MRPKYSSHYRLNSKTNFFQYLQDESCGNVTFAFKYMEKSLFHVNFFLKTQKWTKYGRTGIDRNSSIYIKNHVVAEVQSEWPNFVHHDFLEKKELGT